ncbi:MAG: SRPBCC family protein [Nitrosopumilus sp.]|nr:SRPBCC family protein [Nitrosopumilus sp.]
MRRTGRVRRRATVAAPARAVWAVIGGIYGMERWAEGVTGTDALPGPRRGVGAGRVVRMADGRGIEEYVTVWDPPRSYTYVAVSGLGARAYVATVSLSGSGGRTAVTWESFVCADSGLDALLDDLGRFYSGSLAGLRRLLEKG